MKGYYLILIFVAIFISSCNDCGGDDVILINVVSDNEINYSDCIDFYDENQQKIEAGIERNQYGSQVYYAFLDYRKPETESRYYLEVGDQIKTVDIQTKYDKDPCCKSLL